MTNYRYTRYGDDLTLRNRPHADTNRKSNAPDIISHTDNKLIKIGTDGLEVALVQDYDDDDLELIGAISSEAGAGAPNMEALLRERAMDIQELNQDDQIEANGTAMLKGGLAFQSLEDIRVAFGVRGASRALTHQLVRTRQAAFKQQSQRHCNYGEHPEFRMPESVWVQPELRAIWVDALKMSHYAYTEAVNADVPYEDARYILPEGTTNFILCEYSIRTFMETYAYRACIMFQDEMYVVMRAMRALLVNLHPNLEPHIKISCEKIGKCTYQGPDIIENTCDFPWATEDNRVYRQSRSGLTS